MTDQLQEPLAFRLELRRISVLFACLLGVLCWLVIDQREMGSLLSFCLGASISFLSLEILSWLAWKMLLSAISPEGAQAFLRTFWDFLFLLAPPLLFLSSLLLLKWNAHRVEASSLSLGFSILPASALGAALLWHFRKKI